MKLLIEKITNLRGFYINQARMLLSAEEAIAKGLEKMQDAATDSQLQQAFQSHRQETQVQITRLQRILNHTTGDVDDVKCESIKAIRCL